ADVCHASRSTRSGVTRDLERLRGLASRRIGLLEIEGHLAHFAGVGLDAKVNEDFRDLIKNGIGKGALGAIFHGLPGIVLALAARTVPRMFLEPPARLRIVNIGAPVRRLDRPGDAIERGAIIHEGPAVVAAVGTITQYARGLTFFPFANDLSGE